MVNRFFFISLIITCAILCSGFADASTYLDVKDDAYALFTRLEAEGVIRSGLLSTKPLSRKEALRLLQEAEKNSDGRSSFIKGLVQDLKRRIGPEESGAEGLKPLDSVYAKYVNTNADVRTLTYTPYGAPTREKEQSLNYNNDGDLYGRGSNERAGFVSRAEDFGRFSFFFNPEFRATAGEAGDLIVKKGYAVFDFGWDLIAGKESQWWGPGYHGAILLSNNAEPFTMLEITNPSPGILPWIFKYLGPYRFTFFITTLEKGRADVPEPYLWGMRFDFKPHPNFEIGLARTALLGGRGRPTDLSAWVDSITGRSEHVSNNVGDQRAGYDLKLTLPFEFQPVQVYLEGDGEDAVHLLPKRWAYLYGLYLPRFLSIDRLEFRFEWANTYYKSSNRPSDWYTHYIYTAGYTYHGIIIGHHMGTDSRDVFSELTCRFPEKNARVSLAFDRTEHNMSKDVHETEHELSLHSGLRLAETVDLDLGYGYAWVDNAENVFGVEQRSHSVEGMVTYRF